MINCLHAYIKPLETPLNKGIYIKFCLHKPYIKPTWCLHTFGHFDQKLFISKVNIVHIQVPIWQNPDSHFAYFTINAVRKFSREFDAYFPIWQSLVRISSINSLENFLTILNLKTWEIVSFNSLVPYANIKNWAFWWILRKNM